MDPKKIDQQPTTFLSELYCQNTPATGQKSLYFSNPEIIPGIQESHQQEVLCSSGQTPEIASFPNSISAEDNRQAKPIRRLEPEAGVLICQPRNTARCQARLSLSFTPADSARYHVPLVCAHCTLHSLPSGSCISLPGSLLTFVKGSLRDPVFSQKVNLK